MCCSCEQQSGSYPLQYRYLKINCGTVAMATIKGGCTSYAHVQNVRTGTKHPTSNLRRIGHQEGLSRAGSSMKKIMIEDYDEDYQ